ncbi:MAG TPA: nucleobase:cation symporter-2 family protein [Stellaceae bacterium]|nr:nucleobase:cation symporter-2 family protein [Stellaceae bacterium]
MDGVLHPVDQRPPPDRLIPLALQHVLVMYAGAVAPPLIIAGALKLPKDQAAFLINADLFAAGLVTLIQTVGLGRFVGIRLPVMMGVTFASVSPMIAMGTNPAIGLLGIFGSVMVAGVFGFLIAPLIGRLLVYFPPLVTGTIIAVIGVSLMPIGINWAAGAPVATMPGYGDPLHLVIAGFVLAVILLILKFARGFAANIAVLLGLAAGFILSAALGLVNVSGLAAAAWVDFPTPFHFGAPLFDLVACVTMSIVMIVVLIESTGMFLALGEMTGRAVTPEDLTRGLRADGLGSLIGGIFNTFPYTSFSQNVGLVGVTGVKSRWVCAAGGVIMVLLGLLPKLAVLVASVPLFVLGGAGVVMFGMVAATGIRILAAVDFKARPHNLYIVAIALGIGMIPLVAPKFFDRLPAELGPLLHSGILLAAVAAFLLNLYFNGAGRGGDARAAAAAAARQADHP